MDAGHGGHEAHLASLRARFDRLQYAVTGTSGQSETPVGDIDSAHIRMKALERRVHTASSHSTSVHEILRLQAEHPEIFDQSLDRNPSPSLPPKSLAALTLSHADLYQQLSTQLDILQESSIPDPCSASKLASFQPRIEKAAIRQDQQARKIAELRARSTAVVEQWYTAGVMEMGERWAEWEERVRDVEIATRRMEAAKKRDGGVV